MGAPKLRICFVCLGNICRSPTAEGVLRGLIAEAGLAGAVEVDSAGTAAHHVGESPDGRARRAAVRRGIELRGPARRFEARDFERFDFVLAMDGANLRDLEKLRPSSGDEVHLGLLRAFDPASPPDADVPDPYYGGAHGFDEVLDLCEAACRGLLDRLRSTGRIP